MPEIRTAVRTGDTLAHERRAMQKRPPHILVTTPESLYILLTAGKSRELLRTVKTVIVDEIHAIADDKRGAHLALSLERLEALTHGASDAHWPLGHAEADGINRPISGRQWQAAADPRACSASAVKSISRSRFPAANSGRSLRTKCGTKSTRASPNWSSRIARTLIFVNTRRLAERVAHHLAHAAGRGRGCVASRQPVASPTIGRGGKTEGRRDTRAGRNRIARIGNRYRHGGSGLPDWFSALDCGCFATRGPRRTLARRDPERPPLRHDAR